MRKTTTPIAGMMALVALAALDCAAFFGRRGAERELALWLVPTLNTVLVGLAILRWEVLSRGRSSPFWFGFVVAGLLASGALVLTWLAFPSELLAYSWAGARRLAAFWDDYIKITGGFTNRYWNELCATFRWAAVAVLPIASALLGGWLALRSRLILTRGEESTAPVEVPGRASTRGPRAIPVRRAATAWVVATALLVPAAGVATLVRWRNDHIRLMLIYKSSQRSYARQSRHLMRQATLREEGVISPSEGFVDPSAGKSEAASLRAMAEKSRRDAERYGRISRRYQEAARRPWRSVSPEPPTP